MAASNRVAEAYIELTAKVDRLEAAIDKAMADVGKKADRTGKTAGDKLVNGIGGGLGRLPAAAAGVVSQVNGALALIGVGAGIAGLQALASRVAEAGDQVQQLQARFQVLTGSSQGLELVTTSAQKLGVSIEDAGATMARLAIAGREMGLTTGQIQKMTETLGMLGRIGGASAAETSAGMLQLAQAMASGVLQGDELRSILENMPLLASLLAKQMGVSTGELKNLGAEGKITADVIRDALLGNIERVTDQFGTLPTSAAQASARLENEFTLLFAAIDRAWGVSNFVRDVKGRLARDLAAIRQAFDGPSTSEQVERLRADVASSERRAETGGPGARFMEGLSLPGKKLELEALEAKLRQEGIQATEAGNRELTRTLQQRLEAGQTALRKIGESISDAGKSLATPAERIAKVNADLAATLAKLDKLEQTQPSLKPKIDEQREAARTLAQRQIDKINAPSLRAADAQNRKDDSAERRRIAEIERNADVIDDLQRELLATTDERQAFIERALDRLTKTATDADRQKVTTLAGELFDSQPDKSKNAASRRALIGLPDQTAQMGRDLELQKLELARELGQLTEQQLARRRAELDLEAKGVPLADERARAYLAAAEAAGRFADESSRLSTIQENARDFSELAINGLWDLATATDDASEAAKRFVAQMVQMAIQQIALQPAINALTSGLTTVISGMSSGGGAAGEAGGGLMGLIKGIFGFEDGGVMTKHGPLPLRSYAKGGVASSPQLALYGEGKMNEAYVPLPDGRRIPVDLGGSGGSGGEVYAPQVTVNAPGAIDPLLPAKISYGVGQGLRASDQARAARRIARAPVGL